MTRAKHPPGLSDANLAVLFRKAVLKHYGYRCIICGQGGELEVHHCVHRGQAKLLRWDWRNGVPVHHGDCHAAANRMGRLAADVEFQDYIEFLARKTIKQYLADEGITEAMWRGAVKAALLAELAAAEGGERNEG